MARAYLLEVESIEPVERADLFKIENEGIVTMNNGRLLKKTAGDSGESNEGLAETYLLEFQALQAKRDELAVALKSESNSSAMQSAYQTLDHITDELEAVAWKLAKLDAPSDALLRARAQVLLEFIEETDNSIITDLTRGLCDQILASGAAFGRAGAGNRQ